MNFVKIIFTISCVSLFSYVHAASALNTLRCFVKEEVKECVAATGQFEGYNCENTISSNVRVLAIIEMKEDFQTRIGNQYFSGVFKGEFNAGNSQYKINAIANTVVFKDKSTNENYLDLKIQDLNSGNFLISSDGRPRTDATIQMRHFTTENSLTQMHDVQLYCLL